MGDQLCVKKDTEQPLDLMSTDTKMTYQVTERVKIFFGKYLNHCKNYLELCCMQTIILQNSAFSAGFKIFICYVILHGGMHLILQLQL